MHQSMHLCTHKPVHCLLPLSCQDQHKLGASSVHTQVLSSKEQDTATVSLFFVLHNSVGIESESKYATCAISIVCSQQHISAMQNVSNMQMCFENAVPHDKRPFLVSML